MIEVTADGLGPRPERVFIQDGLITALLRREPMTRADWTTHDYNVHFCIGLQNDDHARREVTLSIEGGQWDALPEQAALLYSASEPEGPWSQSSFPARTDRKKKYAVRLNLGPRQRLFLANTVPRTLDALSRRFETLAAQGGARREIVGRSVDGRDLAAYIYGDPTRHGTLLVSSGFHPPEPDTLASEAIMSYLAEPRGRQVLDDLAVAMVPIANPDGYARQTQGANAAGVNLFWDFRIDDERNCPEAMTLGSFADRLAPRGYIDFHSYTFQLDKRPGPYCRPLFFYRDPCTRAAARRLHGSLEGMPGSDAVRGFSTYAPATLAARLARRFGTITAAKYHLHLKEGVDRSRQRGLEVFRITAQTLIEAGLTTPAVASVGAEPITTRALVYWAGLLRPTLGLLRRGRLGEIDLRRAALVAPQTRG